MKIVLVGCGGIAHSSHLPGMRRYASLHPDYNLVACCDKNASLAQQVAQNYGFARSYTDMDAMLDAEAPDAAVCLVSAHVNHIVGGQLLKRGVPTLLEKPPGCTLSDYAHLLACYEESQTRHMVAFNRRFMPAYARAIELLGDEPLRYIDYTMYRLRRHEEDFSTTAIHGVDAVRHLAGSDYAELDIRYQEQPQHGPGVSNYFLSGAMKNGAAVTLRVVVSTGDISEGCELHTDTRIIRVQTAYPSRRAGLGCLEVIENGRTTLFLRGLDLEPIGQEYAVNGFYHEHRVFYECLASGAAMPSQLCDARQSVALCDALHNRNTHFAD